MKKLALGALLVGLSAACGGGGGGVKLLDAGIDAPTACNPVAKTGCASGEKCTWIVDLDATAMTDEIGHTGCKAAGTIAEGGVCDDAAVATDGTDGCVAGDLCIAGKCKPICDPLATASAAGACGSNYSCSGYAGVFVSGTTVSAGVCEPGCDPLTQKLLLGDPAHLEACGSPDPTQPAATCVPSDNFQSFSCAPSGDLVYPNTDRQDPLTDRNGGIYPNGCAPGFIPFYYEDLSGSKKTICSGLCAPVKVDSEIAKMDGKATLNEGDPEALGKLTADATAIKGHATCAPSIKGSADSNGEDCRFIWGPLSDANGKPTANPYNDKLGVCFAFSKYIGIDGTDDGVDNPTLPEKSCAQLGIVDDPIYGTAEKNGCYPLAQTTFPSDAATFRKIPHWAAKYRVGYGAERLARHILD